MSNIDDEMGQIQKRINELHDEQRRLLEIKESKEKEAKRLASLNKSKEQLELISLREDIKSKINKFNGLAISSKTNVSIGLLTKGGSSIYTINDEGESDGGEYFGEENYYYNEFGLSGWFPSSISC